MCTPSVKRRRVAGTEDRDECRSACRPHCPRAGAVLLTLAAGQFLMTFDSSVMNVAIATVV
jgi:hypothetical protein